MAVGNYLSTKSKNEYIQKIRRLEEISIENVPDEEIEEVRTIYRDKGFEGAQLEEAVKTITSDKKIWVDTMMKDEFGIIEDSTSPFKSALMTFVSFNIVGFIPLLAYVLSYFIPEIKSNTFTLSIILTSIAFFIVGFVKGKIVEKNGYYSGIETLFIGGVAAVIAYFVGYLLRGLA